MCLFPIYIYFVRKKGLHFHPVGWCIHDHYRVVFVCWKQSSSGDDHDAIIMKRDNLLLWQKMGLNMFESFLSFTSSVLNAEKLENTTFWMIYKSNYLEKNILYIIIGLSGKFVPQKIIKLYKNIYIIICIELYIFIYV